ncbi:unnamed protein product [Bursaphelenchus okinawaensis]|uniref:Tetratricopeptide SHNi-TPR domain-containing protein n=1 Tax=Bursaphelenchus okinawaensis TaxID=465554 RepID=A0A811L8G3_9BILA|nr:unnamed protein product [Bursaphelenchus okinawaensis]CAG9117851.1 unnamed protein product [Bursaphelenchus okinawaensis]
MAEVENVAPEVSVDEKAENNQNKVKTGLAEGRKLLIAGNYELAIDRLSDAAQLGVTVFGEFGKEMYDVYLAYARAQLECASEMALVVNPKVDDEADSTDDEEDDEEQKDEAKEAKKDEEENKVDSTGDKPSSEAENASKDSEEQPEDPKTSEEKPEETTTPEEKSEETKEDKEDDKLEKMDEEDTVSVKNENGETPDDALTDMIRSSWDFFELAKKIAQRELESATEKKEWSRKLADAVFGVGQLMIIDEQFDVALDELSKALEIKKEVLDEVDRELAECHHEIARVLNLKEEFPKATEHYQHAFDVINKRIEHLETTKTDENKKEVDKEIADLEDVSREIKAKIKEASEQEKLDEKIKEELRKRLLGTTAFEQVEQKQGEVINDISELVRKRKKPTENTEETDEKRSKTE